MYRFILVIILLALFLFAILNNDMYLFPGIRRATDGKNISIENNRSSGRITLFFPGNTSDILEFKERFRDLKEKNIIIINYRIQKCKFGSYRHALKNALLAYRYASQEYSHIHVVNYSIGNGIFSDILATIYCYLTPPQTITILGGICNIKDVIHYRFGVFSYLFYWVLSNKLNTVENFARYIPKDTPILIIHGEKDKIVPVELALQMHKDLLYKGKNISIQVQPDYGHNEFRHEDYIV